MSDQWSYCPHCGVKLIDTGKFCHACGTAMNHKEHTQPEPLQRKPEEELAETPETPTKKSETPLEQPRLKTNEERWKGKEEARNQLVIGTVVTVALLGLVGAGILFLRNTPTPLTPEMELAGVRLGMRPVEVTLAKGEPQVRGEVTDHRSTDELTMSWVFRPSDEFDTSFEYLQVIFRGDSLDGLEVMSACEKDGNSKLLGFGRFTREADLLERLGEPTNSSISADGLRKMMSWARYNVAFVIEQGGVTRACIITGGVLSFINQYQDPASERPQLPDKLPSIRR